jgi:hypothetical protein
VSAVYDFIQLADKYSTLMSEETKNK